MRPEYIAAWAIVLLGMWKAAEIAWWILGHMTIGWRIALIFTIIAALVWQIIR